MAVKWLMLVRGGIDDVVSLSVGLNSFVIESIPAYNSNISLSVKQVTFYETLKIASV